MLGKRLPIPAYGQLLKLSHTFNLLDARGAISATERPANFATMRGLARKVVGGFPLQSVKPSTLWMCLSVTFCFAGGQWGTRARACVCVCVSVHARTCACACRCTCMNARVQSCTWVRERMHARACVLPCVQAREKGGLVIILYQAGLITVQMYVSPQCDFSNVAVEM